MFVARRRVLLQRWLDEAVSRPERRQPHTLGRGGRERTRSAAAFVVEVVGGVKMADAEHDRHQAEEHLTDLFQPDVLLPSQFFAPLKRKRYSCGEHRLVRAIMQDAIECFQKHIHARDNKRRQLYLEAEQWIMNEEDTGVFSFNNVCELLGVNPDYLREGLLAWRDRERARRRARLFEAPRHRPHIDRPRTTARKLLTQFEAAPAKH
ncbi:MAG: hypothetical protein D6815_04130 [Candidatus Dadabacteria bacterium]|nr:MAG: hypothetical protein D6815_04130 [Candidatus Dadabacteria bacterium]